MSNQLLHVRTASAAASKAAQLARLATDAVDRANSLFLVAVLEAVTAGHRLVFYQDSSEDQEHTFTLDDEPLWPPPMENLVFPYFYGDPAETNDFLVFREIEPGAYEVTLTDAGVQEEIINAKIDLGLLPDPDEAEGSHP